MKIASLVGLVCSLPLFLIACGGEGESETGATDQAVTGAKPEPEDKPVKTDEPKYDEPTPTPATDPCVEEDAPAKSPSYRVKKHKCPAPEAPSGRCEGLFSSGASFSSEGGNLKDCLDQCEANRKANPKQTIKCTFEGQDL